MLDFGHLSSPQFWSCHHMQHWTVSILLSLRLIMKDFFINKSQIDNWLSPKPIVIKTQLKTSIVHTFNNWHASCTRNFKNPPASTYSSLNTENWFFLTINLPNPWRVIWCEPHHPSKFLKQVTNYKSWQISQIKFWSRKS